MDFVAALQFDVDYNRTNMLQGLIVTPRLLTDSDRAPLIKDFTGAQNRALVVAELIEKAQQLTDGGLLRMFERACCTAEGRTDAYDAMLALLHGKVLPTLGGLIKVVEDLVKSHPCH